MKDILEWLVTAEDSRRQAKVKRLMKDIIAIVFFAELANASEQTEIYLFATAREAVSRNYLEPPTGYLPLIRKSGYSRRSRRNTRGSFAAGGTKLCPGNEGEA